MLLICSLILLCTLTLTFYFFQSRQEKLLLNQVESQAKILFKQIVLTRRWVADHGGIFVEKLPWVKKNVYLKNSEIVDISGKRYIKENPAYVTRQLSEYSKEEGLYWFHITSLKLVNPANAPDDFERAALIKFEKGEAKELSKIEYINGSRYYRYIAPLYVEASCITCHPGYAIGSVRGAISVTLPVEHLFDKMSSLKREMVIATFIISIILLTILFYSIRAMAIVPIRRLRDLISDYPNLNPKALKIPSKDEIGSLYKAFFRMRDDLERYHKTLHQKITEATRELQEANKKLYEANIRYRELSKRKSDFISNISHELRTPLTSIKGATDYLKSKFNYLSNDPSKCNIDEIKSFIEIIKSNTERLIKMVNDSLDLEKIESGRLDLHIEELDLSYVIHDTINTFRPIFEERSITTELDLEEPIMAYADEDKIRQVLNNLLSNVLEHCPSNNRVKIEGYTTGDWAIVRITDNGPGIPSQLQKRIFEKFFKGPRGGTGLGLAICKSIIEALNGEIGVISTGGKGSTFYFKLPRVKAENEV